MKRTAQEYELIRQCQDGTANNDEYARLEQLLRDDADFRDEYVRYVNLDTALGSAAVLPLPAADLHVPPPATARSRAWRSLWSAAAGIAIGVLCTSVVFAYVAPLTAKGIILLDEGFETGPPPLAAGVATEIARWSGDFTAVVSAEQSVTPAAGQQMLQFLRADYEGKPSGDGYVADLYQLVDLRPYQREFAAGESIIQLSAAFNATAFPANESYSCVMSLHAIDGELLRSRRLTDRQVLNAEALAMTSNSRLLLDRNPASWQRHTAELRLSPNTEFLLVRVGVTHATKAQQRVEFPGQYLDEVRLVLTRRPPLP